MTALARALLAGCALLAGALIAAGACQPVIPSEAQSDITDDDRACAGDDVCVAIASGRCSCNSAGALTAVREDAAADVDARRAVLAPELCNAAISDDETCCATGTACVDGRCELLGPRGHRLIEDCADVIEQDPAALP